MEFSTQNQFSDAKSKLVKVLRTLDEILSENKNDEKENTNTQMLLQEVVPGKTDF